MKNNSVAVPGFYLLGGGLSQREGVGVYENIDG